MKKKPIWRPREKAHQRLLEHVDERIDLIHQGLRTLYMESNVFNADVIHGMRKEVFYLREIFFHLLFDLEPAEKILADLKEQARRR